MNITKSRMLPKMCLVLLLLWLNISAGNKLANDEEEDSMTVVAIQQRKMRNGNALSVLNRLFISRAKTSHISARDDKMKSERKLTGEDFAVFKEGKLCHYDKNDVLVRCGSTEIKSDSSPAVLGLEEPQSTTDSQCENSLEKHAYNENKLNIPKDGDKPVSGTQNPPNPNVIMGEVASRIYTYAGSEPPSPAGKEIRGFSTSKTGTKERQQHVIGVAQTKVYKIIPGGPSIGRVELSEDNNDGGQPMFAQSKTRTLKVEGEGVPLKIPATGDHPAVTLYVSQETRDRILAEGQTLVNDTSKVSFVSGEHFGWNPALNKHRMFNKLQSAREKLTSTIQGKHAPNRPTALKFVRMGDPSPWKNRILASIIKRKLKYGERPVQLSPRARREAGKADTKITLNAQNHHM